MVEVPETLRRQLHEHRQEHVLTWWNELDDVKRRSLLEQLLTLDLAELRALHQKQDETASADPMKVSPPEVIELGGDVASQRSRGEACLRAGEVGVILVAGGQGTRLGFDHPKGMYPIGPVTGKTLFQIHAEKVLASSRRHGKTIPFLVMTSPVTHDETVAYFRDNRCFGLDHTSVHFFCQGTMPAMDLATGKVLMEEPHSLALSPNGHGGTIPALVESGLAARMKNQGIRLFFYFQVDNPLVKVADPVYLGHHLAANAEMSMKVVRKENALDKLGNVVSLEGKYHIIEYSEMPEEMARSTDSQGRLRFWAGSPAINIFTLDFLERMWHARDRLPYHRARKKVPYLNPDGKRVKPDKENALKLEKFIFDVLPLAERCIMVETDRREEFVPLKNATGADSPEMVRAAISELAAGWLRHAGIPVANPVVGGKPLEIGPLHALDADELKQLLADAGAGRESLLKDWGV